MALVLSYAVSKAHKDIGISLTKGRCARQERRGFRCEAEDMELLWRRCEFLTSLRYTHKRQFRRSGYESAEHYLPSWHRKHHIVNVR